MKTILQKLGILIAVAYASLSAYAYDFEVDGIYYDVVSLTDFTCSVTSGTEKYSGDIEIPSEVKYNNRTFSVNAIGKRAFSGCSSLTSVTIPDSVTEIGQSAFYDCSSLTSVTIPDSVTEIGEDAFYGCSSLVSIKLSDSLKSIGFGLFYNCKSLESLSSPGSVKEIYQEKRNVPYYTFENCYELKMLRIEYSPEELMAYNEYYAYNYGWSDWTKRIEVLYIDRALKSSIPVPNLKKLELGANLKKVDVAYIESNEELTTIESHALEPPTLPEMSNKQYMNIDVIVPAEAFDAYQADENWGKFWNLQAGVDGVKVDSKKEEIGRYDINGRAVSEGYQGLVIVRFSDGTCKKILNH